MHANPIVVNGVMYVTTPSLKAVALHAATGREIWSFDPAKYNNGNVVRLRNRGLVYWKGTEGERIFHFVRDRVYAIDAKSGALISSFGNNGFIDLRQNLGVDPASAVIEMTSPGAVFKNVLIIASRVNESYDASPGHIRAYDTVTGALEWTFHTIPREGQVGHDSWTWVKGENYGGANAWGGVTIDEQRGWVFAATGSATEDFYGGFRKGDNLFANSVLALDATTGERKWHYQTVRHDIWDYDNPPAPILVTIGSGATAKDAVVQLTKMGFTFVLDRDTGKPLFPVHEVPVPRSTVPGEETAPTQLVPLKPQPLVRQTLTEADLTNITPEARAQALQRLPSLPVRSDLHPAESAGHDHHAGASGRRRVARRQLRSGVEHALRQRQRGADDQQAAAGPRRAGSRRPEPRRVRTPDLRSHLRRLSRRRATRDAAAHPAARRREANAAGDRDRHRAGPQRHAGLPTVPAARAHRPVRVS